MKTEKLDLLCIGLQGIIIGLALMVIFAGIEDVRSGQKWEWHEAALAGIALALATAGFFYTIFPI